jgi:hypothetical protein
MGRGIGGGLRLRVARVGWCALAWGLLLAWPVAGVLAEEVGMPEMSGLEEPEEAAELSASCCCTENYDPVCGLDGVTYGNSCFAGCAGMILTYEGACRFRTVDFIDPALLLEIPPPPAHLSSLDLAWELGGLAGDPGQLVTLDGFSLTDPLSGTAVFALPLSVLERVELLSAGLPPSLGPTDSGALLLHLPHRPRAWRGEASFRAMPAELRHGSVPRSPLPLAPIPSDWTRKWSSESLYSLGLSASGPVVPEQLWAVAALGLERFGFASDARYPPGLEDPPPNSQWRLGYLAELVWLPASRHELTALSSGQPGWAANLAQDPYRAPEAELDSFSDAWLVGLGWKATWLQTLLQETRVSFTEHSLAIFPSSGCTDLEDRACASHYDSETGFTTGNGEQASLQRGRRLFVETGLTGLFPEGKVYQALRGGLQYAGTWARFEEGWPGGAHFTDASGRPRRVVQPVPGADGRLHPGRDNLDQGGLGIHLDYEVVYESLRLQAGARADLFWMHRAGHAGELRTTQVGPRLVGTWDPWNDGLSTVRLGYMRGISDPGHRAFRELASTGFSTETYEYNPASQEYDIFVHANEVAEPASLSEANLPLAPVDTVHFGLHRRLGRGFDASAGLNWRHTETELEVPLGASAPEEVGVRTSTWNDLALQVLIRLREFAGWQAALAYTWRQVGRQVDKPTDPASPYSLHSQSYDGHRLTALAVYRAPWGLSGALALHWIRGVTLNMDGLATGWLETTNIWPGDVGIDWGYDHGDELPNGPAHIFLFSDGQDLARLDFRLAWSLEELIRARVEVVADLYLWLDPDPDLTSEVWLALGLRYLL